MLTTDCPDRATLQSKIDCTLTGFQKKIKRLDALDIPVNFDTLFEVKTAHIAGITIEQGFNEEIERLESLGKIHSATKHRYALQVLEGYKPTSMAMGAIDLDYLKGLELYLRKRGNKDNSIATRADRDQTKSVQPLPSGQFVGQDPQTSHRQRGHPAID